jgi:RNA polymerase sigma-70 factor (ECF subfamily)
LEVINLNQQEKELIELVIDKNRQAQHQVYTSFAPKMLGVCRQYIKDIHQAEDILLVGFMKVFNNINTFEFKGSFEGWIRRIMINECVSHIRVQKKWLFIDDENYFDKTVNPIESQLSIDDIQFLIDQLPDGCKMVFNLYVIERWDKYLCGIQSHKPLY